MHFRKILTAGVVGGILFLVVTLIAGAIGTAILPYDILDIPGMRPVTDPVSVLFFLYPFVLACAGAVLFDFVSPALPGDLVRRGILFGLLLIVISTIPNLFVIWSSMNYPAGFYLSNILSGIIGFPLFGILCARIWGNENLQRLKREAAGM
jgi:hypothetical protein